MSVKQQIHGRHRQTPKSIKFIYLLIILAIENVIVLDGIPTTYTVIATEIKAESEANQIRIPIQKTPIQFAQVDA